MSARAHIRSDDDWEATLYPALRAFLLKAACDQPRLRIALDAHATLAFAAGSVLNIKSGRHIELEQRTTARRIWSPDDATLDPSWATLVSDTVELSLVQPDVAVAVGLTHDVAPDVRRYVEQNLPSVGRLLILRSSTGVGAKSTACGAHAFKLADEVVNALRNARPIAAGTTHMFIAAPNAFTFFLGQRQDAIGRVRLYEFDFEGGRDRSYTAALTLPVLTRQPTSSGGAATSQRQE